MGWMGRVVEDLHLVEEVDEAHACDSALAVEIP